MSYHLRIYDNFHYMDENEAYNHGRYATYAEAETAATTIIREFLDHNLQHGITVDKLSAQWALYGEDPVICDEQGRIQSAFSARQCLERLITEMKHK